MAEKDDFAEADKTFPLDGGENLKNTTPVKADILPPTLENMPSKFCPRRRGKPA